MKRAILDARSAGDSVGSELECVVTGVPAGVGGLLFGGMESRIAGMLYAIPGVKGVELAAASPSPKCAAAKPTTPSA